MVKILTLIFTLFLISSCIKKGDESLSSTQSASDLTITLVTVSPASAVMGTNQTKQFTGIGGNAPYTYSISSGLGTVSATGLYTAPGVLGNATIKVEDIGGNAAYAVIVIGSQLQISPTSKLMGTSENFTFTGIGGVQPYTFRIASGSGSINSTTGAYTSPAAAQTVQIELKDANNSITLATVNVVSALSITPTTLTIEDLTTSNFAAAGGLAPYTYSIYSGSGAVDGLGDYTASGTVGVEILRVTDANLETAEATITVVKGPSLSSTNLNIAPGREATISSSEGTAPFTYALQSGTGTVHPTTGVFTAPAIADQSVIRGTDANGFFDDITLQTYNLKKVAMGDNHMCGIHIQNDNVSSDVKCWGYSDLGRTGNGNSQLGDAPGEMGDSLPALDFGPGNTPIAIGASLYQHKCAVFANNKMKCWGNGSNGRRGSGNQTHLGQFSGQMGGSLPYTILGHSLLVDPTKPITSKVSVGSSHTCVSTNNSLGKCFGHGGNGRLGNAGGGLCHSTATCGDNVASLNLGVGKTLGKIVAGHEHSCAIILPDNTLYCWGAGSYGRLGSGNGFDIPTLPKDAGVVQLGTGRTVLDVAIGYYHTCALLDNNTVKCFGRNNTAQLGMGISTATDIGDGPGEMNDALASVDLGSVSFPVSIHSKGYVTCAVFDNGKLKCWGQNNYGQLGQGSTATLGDSALEMGDNLTFIDIGAGETVSQIDVGSDNVCVITNLSNLKCWGQNLYGQLGIESEDHIGNQVGEMGAALASVDLGTGKTAVMVANSLNSTCALLNDNTVKCWGYDENGSLGQVRSSHGDALGETGTTTTSIDVGFGFFAIDIFAGRYHTCAIRDDNSVKCWGEGGSGRLGQGNTGRRGDRPSTTGVNLPLTDLGLGLGAVSGSAWENQSCAILNSGDVKCWGEGANGRRGSDNQNDKGDGINEMGDNLLTLDLGVGRTATQVVNGNANGCALLDDGSVKCWGYNLYGQLGLGDNTQRAWDAGSAMNTYGTLNMGTGRTAKQIAMGHEHMCTLLDNDKVKCWGRSNYGQTGYETTANIGDDPLELGDSHAEVALGTGRTATMIALGLYHSCALLDNNQIKCWGRGDLGALGRGAGGHVGNTAGHMGNNLVPVILEASDIPLKIYAAGYYTCAVMESNDVKCWGYNNLGQLGHGHRYRVGIDPLSMGSNLPASF